MKAKFINAVPFALFLIVLATPLYSQHSNRHKASGNGWRYNFGTSLNNYTLNDKHGQDPRQKMNATFGIRRELRVTRDYKTFVLFGGEYLFHGLNYRSYFFKPDSFKVYDRKYSYNYALSLHEIHIPFEIKYLLRRVDNSLFSPYILFGYHLRYLLPARLTVTKDGEVYKKDHPDMIFRNALISKKVNASLCASLGWQLNRLGSSRRAFFAEISFQYGFSDYYFTSDYSANSMYINCIQATFNIGAKL